MYYIVRINERTYGAFYDSDARESSSHYAHFLSWKHKNWPVEVITSDVTVVEVWLDRKLTRFSE